MESERSRRSSQEQLEEKKLEIIKILKDYIAAYACNPKLKEFEKYGFLKQDFKAVFGGITKLLNEYGLPAKVVRSKNLNDEELRAHLKSIRNAIDSKCPSFQKPGTICFEKCTCWLTTSYYINAAMQTQIIRYQKKQQLLYRVSYQLFKGQIPQEMVVAHHCDNSLCYNPDHLDIKTQKQNVEDSIIRGRFKGWSKGNQYYLLRKSSNKRKDPYDYSKLLDWIKGRIKISDINEWLFTGSLDRNGYASINIGKKHYKLHRLVLANKLGVKYEDIAIARHVLPDGSEGQKHDLNPDHLLNGSRRDNANDSRHQWVLKEDDIRYIHNELSNTKFVKRGDAGLFDAKMAVKFDVSQKTIADIRRGHTYLVYGKQLSPGLKGFPVVQLDGDGKFLARFNSGAEAARVLNLKKSKISKVCNGLKNKHGGFRWMFESDYQVRQEGNG